MTFKEKQKIKKRYRTFKKLIFIIIGFIIMSLITLSIFILYRTPIIMNPTQMRFVFLIMFILLPIICLFIFNAIYSKNQLKLSAYLDQMKLYRDKRNFTLGYELLKNHKFNAAIDACNTIIENRIRHNLLYSILHTMKYEGNSEEKNLSTIALNEIYESLNKNEIYEPINKKRN